MLLGFLPRPHRLLVNSDKVDPDLLTSWGRVLDYEVDRPCVAPVERPFFDVVPCVFVRWVVVESPFQNVGVERNRYGALSTSTVTQLRQKAKHTCPNDAWVCHKDRELSNTLVSVYGVIHSSDSEREIQWIHVLLA